MTRIPIKRKKVIKPKARKFTKVEDQYIKDNYEKITASEIAKKLGRTRSSILGRANRLGLNKIEAYNTSREFARINKVKTEENQKQRRLLGKDTVAKVEQSNLSKTLIHLKRNQCHAPLEDNTWCGDKVMGQHSYCSKHMLEFYKRQSKPKKNRTSYYTPLTAKVN